MISALARKDSKRVPRISIGIVLLLLLVLSWGCSLTCPLALADEDGFIRAPGVREFSNVGQDSSDILLDNDRLFSGFVDKSLAGESDAPIFGDYGEEIFSGGSLALYKGLKAQFREVAHGDLGSTAFHIDFAEWGADISLSDAEFGSPIVEDGQIKPEAIQELTKKTLGSHSFTDVVECLLYDCPYALYWFDKTEGYYYSTGGCKYSPASGVLTWDSGASCEMFVEKAYSKTGAPKTFAVNTDKTSAAKKAMDNAKAIVRANAGKSDYQKLLAYKDKICELTSYNFAAAENDDTAYGDPWQIIYVFDGDPSTNVVCEGYAKAFQYLCDSSTFNSDCAASCIVTGTIDGGGHMWNNVLLDDATYLVDVTNCDTGMVGHPDGLFLVGTKGSISSGYSFKMKDGQTVNYRYDDQTLDLYENSGQGTDMLELSSTSYAPVEIGNPTKPGTVTYGYSSAPKTKVHAVIDSGYAGGTLKYQWYMKKPNKSYAKVKGATSETCKLPQGLAAGSYQLYCKVTLVKSGKTIGSRNSAKTTFKVNKASLSKGVTVKVGDVTYTGKQCKPAVAIRLGAKKLASGKDFTVSYKGNIAVGTGQAVIKGKGNYTGSVTRKFKINPKGTKISKVKAAGRGFTVKWGKQKAKMAKSRITGYQVRYSTKSNMKSAHLKGVKRHTSTSAKIKKLKAKTQYYVQVRTYMKLGGKNYYSSWSDMKAVTTKR